MNVLVGAVLNKQAFGARFEMGILIIPQELSDAAAQGSRLDVETLLSCLHTFPSIFKEAFGWTQEEVCENRDALVRLLKGRVADEFLYPVTSLEGAYGALPPQERETLFTPKDDE